MDFKWLFILALLFVGGEAFAQAYKWVDEDGVVHYSDRPVPGSERIDLPESDAPARPAQRPTPRTRSTDADEPEEASNPYTSITFTSPASEETLWNIGGVLNVTLSVSPTIQPGHQIRVYYDGQARMVQSLSFQITEVYRGAHNLQAEVLDQNGNLLIRSEPTRFYVQQTSVLRAPGASGPQTAP